MDYPKASMHTPAAHLKTPAYILKGEKKTLPTPSSADILPLNYTPAVCCQAKKGPKSLCDYDLQRQLRLQLKLSTKIKQQAEAARKKGESIFRHVFGVNCKFFFNNIIFHLLITYNKLIGNMIEVFQY